MLLLLSEEVQGQRAFYYSPVKIFYLLVSRLTANRAKLLSIFFGN